MTVVKKILSDSPAKITPMISYQVAMHQPESHLYEVRLRVQDWQASVMDLKMPVWTPGSYLVREYAKNLQDFTVLDIDERSIPWCKKAKITGKLTLRALRISRCIIGYLPMN